MQILPTTFQNESDFNKVLTNLSTFRNLGDPTKQRIVIQRNGLFFTAETTKKVSGFRQVIEFFYKPHHKRLNNVLHKTVLLLEANQKFLIGETQFKQLLAFRSRLLSIHKIHQKAASSLQNLNNLIINIQKTQLDIEQKKVQDVQENAQKIVTTEKKKQQELLEESQRIGKWYEFKMSEIQLERLKLQKDYSKIRKFAISIDTPSSFHKFLNSKHDLVFYHPPTNQNVSANSFLFPKLDLKNPNVKNQNGQYWFPLSNFRLDTFKIALKICYGAPMKETLELKDFILLCCTLQTLSTELTEDVVDFLKNIFAKDEQTALAFFFYLGKTCTKDSMHYMVHEGNHFSFFVFESIENIDLYKIDYPSKSLKTLAEIIKTIGEFPNISQKHKDICHKKLEELKKRGINVP